MKQHKGAAGAGAAIKVSNSNDGGVEIEGDSADSKPELAEENEEENYDGDSDQLRFKSRQARSDLSLADPHEVVQPLDNDFSLKTQISRATLSKAAAD